ncbi:hypothetical protein ACKKBG_A38200 [Auxenochlorella protothecoides x Auxenochlorella symbiontica]
MRAGMESQQDADLEETLARDIKSFQQRASSQQKLGQAGPSRFQASEASEESSSGFLATLEKGLVFCVFFVLFALAWLGAGLASVAVLHSSAILDLWYILWPLVFQPALGVLMLGALTVGAAKWVTSQGAKKQS